jgi:hypothetical protein
VRQGVLGTGALAVASLALPEIAFAQGDTISNLICNPRAARSLAGWVGYAPEGLATPPVRRSSTGLNTPPSCAELTFTSAAKRGALLIGHDATTPCAWGDLLWVQAAGQMVAGTPGAELHLTIGYLDSQDNVVAERTLYAMTATPGQWSQMCGFDTAPARAVACYVGVWLTGTNKPESVMRATNAMIVLNPPTMPDYFDGDQTGCSWTGTPHASPSIGPAPLPAVPTRAGFLRGWNDNAVIQGGWTPAADAALNAGIGMTVLRVTCDLRDGWVTPNTNKIDWLTPNTPAALIDQLNNECAARGIKLLPIPLGAPSWMVSPLADTSVVNPPISLRFADWAGICAQMATRWRSNLAGIEIWNEPNTHAYWRPRPSPGDYTRLLNASATAVRAAAPGVPVLVGGLSGRSRDNRFTGDMSVGHFLSQMYGNAGAKGNHDGVGLHPYPGTPTSRAFASALRSARGAMAAGGDTTPLWITEVGISTTGDRAVTPDKQSAVDRLLYAMLKRQPDVQAVCWHTSVAPAGLAASDPESGFAFVDRVTQARQPVYAAIQAELAGE